MSSDVTPKVGTGICAGEQSRARLRAEMRVREGKVPDRLADCFYDHDGFSIRQDAFIFRTRGGVGFSYRMDHGIIVELPENGGEAARDEMKLFLWGTVFGAVAWLNGLLPLHASAVSRNGRVVAFTAESGGGKSTLAAGLARRDWAHVCDDTLVLSAHNDELLALPDDKPLKLWNDAFDLVPSQRMDRIHAVPGKFYAKPESKEARVLPLRDLVFLEWGDSLALTPIFGAEKLRLLPDAMYRLFVHLASGHGDRHARFMLGVAGSVRFWRLSRPRAREQFDDYIQNISQLLENSAG